MFMDYPEPNRAGSHGTSGMGVVIVCYVSLITCCSAKDDAVGAWVVLRRPRGVIYITWGVIDKVGLNRLLVPITILLSQPTISPPYTIMPRFTSTYTIPFDPVCNGPGEFASAKETFNRQQFVHKRGSRTTPYPSFVDIYGRSE
jgi:hypothetical protein